MRQIGNSSFSGREFKLYGNFTLDEKEAEMDRALKYFDIELSSAYPNTFFSRKLGDVEIHKLSGTDIIQMAANGSMGAMTLIESCTQISEREQLEALLQKYKLYTPADIGKSLKTTPKELAEGMDIAVAAETTKEEQGNPEQGQDNTKQDNDDPEQE